MKRLLFLLLAVLLIPTLARAATFSVPVKVSQGHAFPVSVTHDAPFEASFLWRGEKLLVRAEVSEGEPSLWKAEALLAMPLDAGGKHRVVLEAGGEKKAFLIQAAPVAWPQSILKVAPKYVAPPREVQEQIARDAARSKKALASRTERQWTLPLHRPVPGGVTSPFGGRRVFNGQPRANGKQCRSH